MKSIQRSFDVLVVGAGSAGLALAVTAAEKGASVGVVERASEIGGALHLTSGHLSGAGTRLQERRGIDDSTDLHFADVMRASRNTARADLVRRAVDLAPGTIDWLEELGCSWTDDSPAIYWGHERYSRPRTHLARNGGSSILEALMPMWDRGVEDGNIAPFLRCTLGDLTVEKGSVAGVLAAREDGALLHLSGKSTVLATGGYGSSPELFRRLTPGNPRLVTNAHPSHTGDGLLVAEAHGAEVIDGSVETARLGTLEVARGSGRADLYSLSCELSPQVRPPREVWVNIQGERFIAEDEPAITKREHAVLRQPGREFWIIFDDLALDEGPCLVRQWTVDDLRRASGQHFAFASAPDLEALARAAGIAIEGLQQTVERYNVAVQRQEDWLGRKYLLHEVRTPPFYAVRAPASTVVTFGGLRVDDGLQVLRPDGSPIEGLYACGEIIGAASTSGNAISGGMLLTPALSFGRYLGRKLLG
jgi:fumarate reductase flavoprotein subunit